MIRLEQGTVSWMLTEHIHHVCVCTGEVYVSVCAGVYLCVSVRRCLLVMSVHVKVFAGLTVILGKFSHRKLSSLFVCSS